MHLIPTFFFMHSSHTSFKRISTVILCTKQIIPFKLFFLVTHFLYIFTAANANELPSVQFDQSKPLIADQNKLAWKKFNISTVESYVIPAYKNLMTANNNLHLATQSFCNSLPSTNSEQALVNLKSIKKVFHYSMDAWQYIQNINFGPIEISIRNHSIQFWPDKKNHIGKQLNKLISGKDLSALMVDGFEKNSISVKGLPAIERLLFQKNALEQFKNKPFSCEVLQGISRYLSATASSLHNEWLVIMLPQFKDATQLDGYFEDDIDAATSLLKTLVEPIEIIRDLKLDRPLGSQFDKAKFKRLESWRSRRSLVNLKLNLQSLELFFMGTTIDSTAEKTERDKGLRALLTDNESIIIENNFKLVKDELHRFKVPLEEAILIKKGYQTAKSLSISLTKLHKSLEEAITHSGIRLGFNSRDGD